MAEEATTPQQGQQQKVEANGRPADLHVLRDRGRAHMLAALQDGGELAGDPKPTPEDPAKAAEPADDKKPKAKAKPAADDLADDPDEDADDLADDVEASDDLDEDAAPERPADPETAKRVARIQAQERRSREALAKERAEFERERDAWKRDRSAREGDAETFARIKSRAKYDPAAALEALGLGDDDYEAAARDLYARSKAAAADPKHREAAAEMQRRREEADSVKSLRKELDELKSERAKERAEARAAREIDAYFDAAVKAADDDAPLFRRRLDKNPTAAQRELAAIATEFVEKKGRLPEQRRLLAVYEKRRRAELEELGVDVDALVAKRAAGGSKDAARAADKKDSAIVTTTTTAASQATGSAVAKGRNDARRRFESGEPS